ncbi:hypothetical protein INR49_017555 [Caranx melampygus]|nr:hypothetical protein INR49_017555 [Caranx melampygus]
MGTVHARSLDPLPMRGPELGVQPDDIDTPELDPEPKQEVLENKDVVVQRVHIDGLGRTKEDLLTYEIAEVFRARNLIDVMRKSHEARQKLLRLGIFRKVEVVIDTSRGEDALPNGLDVTFEVTELRRMTGSYNTMVGNNEGSMVLGLKLPNVFGRAEKLTFQFSYGTKETSYGLSFFKPQPGHFERNVSINLYKVTGQFPWSSLRETDRGISAELSFPVWKTSQTLKWEGVWRELGCLARTASFAVREESGHSLKSSLSHAMVIDTRNSSILPRKGGLLKIHQELAGYTGGDASFLKEDFEIQLNRTLLWDSVLSASLWGGLLLPIGDKPTSIADRFYLGGPTSIRGFSMYSMGPQSEGDYLGGEAYWAGGLHLYTPLPFRPGRGGFGDLFRTHFFLNAGNLCNLNYGEGPQAHLKKLAECIRWSYGLGIVLRLGNIARLELNYCIPMGVQSGDSWFPSLLAGYVMAFSLVQESGSCDSTFRGKGDPRGGFFCSFIGGLFCERQTPGRTLMAVTIEDLYRNYGILADAKDNLSQHKDAYQVILDGVKGGPKEKRLAAQFIPKFFSSFPELADAAINAQLDLCEDEDVSIRRQAIKELPRFATGENILRVADILTQLLQTDDTAEFNQVNAALISIFKIDAKGTLGGLFSQILQGEDIVRERAIKFLSTKLKTLPEDVMTKEVEEYVFAETKKVLEDVTGEEFVLLMRVVSGLRVLQTVHGRQQLVELVVEQAFLEQALNPADPDTVDRLLQCTRQALPLFSKNVHSTRFVTYFCEHVLPNLSTLTSPVAELDIQLEVLKLLAEMSPFCGDMDKLEANLNMLFTKLLEFMPLPPEEVENGENSTNEEPKLQFSYVECLLYGFHQLGKKLPDFLLDKVDAERLKDFKIRLQYFARGLQVYIRQLRVALQGKTGDALKTEENKIKVVALKITNNINVLIKDLFHNPPSYKSTVTLSWKPVQKAEAVAPKRPSVEEMGSGASTKNRCPLCPGGMHDKSTTPPAASTAPQLAILTMNVAVSGVAEDEALEPEATGAGAESTETHTNTYCSLSCITSGSFLHHDGLFVTYFPLVFFFLVG